MRFEGGTASRLLTVGFIASALVCGAWLGLNQMMGAASGLDRVENLTLDWRFLLAGARPAPPGVVIVAIDDQTLSEAEVHAVSRGTLARLVRAIVDLHAQAVALDIAFPDSKGEKEDGELADALKSTTSVVASIGIFGEGEPSGGGSQSGSVGVGRETWRSRPSRPRFFGRPTRSGTLRKRDSPMCRRIQAESRDTFHDL